MPVATNNDEDPISRRNGVDQNGSSHNKTKGSSGSKMKSDDNASFLRAARGGNLEKVLEYLKANTDINTCNANGLNALHLAAKEGHVGVVKELLSRGARIDAATKKGNTALHIASLAGQEEVVRILVDNGASVNVQSQNGFTPLYMAAQENHDGVVRFLLASGANQSLATEDGFTPLAVALQQGHDKVVAVLLENDTRGKVRLPALHIAAKKDDTKAAGLLLQSGDHNPDVTSKSGFTPLHIAAHYGNENIAALLLQRNANVNYAAKHNITPLHVAAKWGKANMVALLLDKGANLESKTRDGLTPLHCAARSGHENVVDMMLQRGAPISAKTKNGLAPLHMASQGDHVDAARILLHHKAPVDEVTVDYLTALHVAAHCGHVRVAKLLLDRKADPNARALNGFTPLHIACKKNRIKVVELLLKYGASIEATTESGLTPLHVASFMGCMNIVIFLIQNQASPDEATVRGETPLHLAARANQTDIIRILLRNGAKVDARAREQQTPLHIASRLGNVDIVALLLQSGAQVDASTKDLYTALHIAAKEGQEDVASVLIDHNASLTAMTKKGFTPLHLAAKYGNLKVSNLLLEKNSTPAVVDAEGKNGVTPLHVAAHYDHQNVALLLLDKGASPHAAAKNGYTPLHITAKKNQLDIATSLLEYGAKTDAESKAGFTPLHLASQEGHVDMTNLLLKHEADPNAKAKNGLAPIHLCAQEDRVNVAAILAANGADLNAETKAGYTPLHVACHFGSINMVRFLLEREVNVDVQNELGYTALHQAAQQGHTQIVNMLLENNASPNTLSISGQTPLSIAQRLGYISVVETLKVVTEREITTTTTTTIEEKYKVNAPESMQETFMSDSEDEGGDENMIGEHSYKYLTVDEMKSLGDDSMPIDVTHDEKHHGQPQVANNAALGAPPGSIEEKLVALEKSRDYKSNEKNFETDNVDLPTKHPINIGDASPTKDSEDKKIIKLSHCPKRFLVSFMVDARGGAMRGCRHSGVRVIIPPRKAPMPMRITCRYLKKDKLIHPPPMMEGEAIASRILELGPAGAKFLGPVIIEVPHFAALRGKEREIVILRSDNGETWKEHTLEATEDAVQEVLQESFDADELSQLEDLNTNRITRILTTDFPQYFAIVSRIRQEVHAIGPEGGVVNSTVVPQVQAVFPQGALTKKIKVGLQAHPIPPELTAKLLGNRVAVSPIVTVEPRRRKFHKPITLTIPVPQAAGKGMINQYNGETPTLRLLCSITGGTTRAQWEDVTGSTPLSFVNECVNFTTTVSARFWLMDCRNVSEATKMATELYREAIHVPFMAKFVVFAKRHETLEARLRVFCMTDDKEDKTLEHQEHFVEVAKSRDVEVLEGKSHFVEFGGNLVPVTKSGEQLSLRFFAFRENRLPFNVKVKDPHSEALGRIAFMREPKSSRQEVPQTPICNLNVALPDNITPEPAVPTEVDLEAIQNKYAFLREAGYGKFDTIHRADLRISDIGNLLGSDWVRVAHELEIADSDINIIKSEYPDNNGQQAMVMLRFWLNMEGNRATGNALERALRKAGRDDIVNKCIFNVELVTDEMEKSAAKAALHSDMSGFDSLKEELGPSRESTLPRQEAISEKDDHDVDDDEAEDEGDKLAAEEKITEKMSFRHQQQFETDAASPEEVAELAHHRSPSPPAQAAEEAVSISPAEERHFSSEDEDESGTDGDKEPEEDILKAETSCPDTATEQLAVPAQPHPVTTQQSSSYEEEEDDEAPAARKASTSSSSASSAASSKGSVGSRDVDDPDQAELLESAEQELLDEMIVRDDVPEVPVAVPVPAASAPPTIQEEDKSEQKMEHQATTDPFIGSIETATAPSSASFESYSRFQHQFQEVTEQQQSESSIRSLHQEQEEVLTFQQKKVFWESRTSGESSPTGSEKESLEKISPQKKEHFETFVKPSLDDTNTEAEDLEYKAIPSEKLDTPIDQDKMITRQIRDGIVDMELEQGDEPVMTDSWIDKRSSTSSSAPQLEPETPEEHRESAAAVVKKSGIKFVDVEEDKPKPDDAQRAAERLVESIKMKAVIIAEEIRRSPYEQETVEPDTPSSQDNNHIEMAREVATDFISALTSKAVELAEKITPMLPKDDQHVQFEVEEESEELEVNEIITYHASAGIPEPQAALPRDFRLQTSFRAHFVRPLDEYSIEEVVRGRHGQARVHLIEGSEDDYEEEQIDKSQQFSSDKQSGESRKFESRDDDHFTSDDINEDIWAEQSKVTYRKKMFVSSTSSSIKKTSDTESSSKIGDRRSGTDFESSSCDNFMTARDGTPGLSRPSSSDVEILLSAVSHRSSDLTTTADYETAQTSHHDTSFRSNATTSGEYHTAVSSLMSEESLKSIDESSGNLGSIEVSDVKSDTLKDAAIEFDRESLNTPIGPPHDEEVIPSIHLPGSVLLEGTPDTDTEDSSFVSHMVRSAEMIFHPEPHTLKELMGQPDEEVDDEAGFEPEEVDQIDFKNLSESRETLSASILTISSTSEVTILQPQVEAPELKVHEASDEDKKMFQLSESSSSSASVSEKAIQSVTPQTGSCDFLSSVEELKKDDSPIPATRPTPLPRVVSFETSVFFESSRMREQKSFDSEFGSRPESELKELESRPHSISESVLSRSSSEDQRPTSKEDVSDSEMNTLLRVTEPFARPHTPEPPEKVIIKNTVVFSEDALQEADIAFSQHFTGVLDELSEEAQIVPEVEILTAVELDEGSDLLVGSPPMVSRPLSVKYWPPSDELNLEDDGAGPLEKQMILRSESEDYGADDYPQTRQDEQEREIEEKKRWLESQFDEENGSEGDNFQFMYSQPLDQIMEEEDEHDSVDDVTERELRKLKESLSSTPDFDNIHIRRHIALRGDKDDVSMSSLQEFERLEREVALRGSGSESRGSLGSQDSLEVMAATNGRNHVNNKSASKCSAGDDISIDSHSSLQEFEKMEAACREAESIERKAKEQEDVLSEIEEGHESQISESDSCETLSEAGKSDNSDDYEQRMFQIDEIIKQAQSNVERFEEKKKKELMEQSAEMLPLEEILGGWTDVKTESSVVDKTASVDTGDSDSLEGDPVPDLPDEFSNVMQTSVDSLDLKMRIMQTSADSLDLRGGQMTISTDSIEPEAAPRPGIMTESVDSLDGGCAAARGTKATSSSPPEPSSNVYLSGAAALITSTDSLESCSTRATASMLSSMTSNTSADLEFDNRAQFRSEAKKFFLSQGEIPIEDSDESSCSNVVMTSSSSTTTTVTSRVVIAEKSKLSKDAAAAITTTFDVEKFDSSCEETYEETDEYGNRKHIVIKRSMDQPFAEKTEIVGDAVDVVAQRRLNQGLGIVSQAIFRDL